MHRVRQNDEGLDPGRTMFESKPPDAAESVASPTRTPRDDASTIGTGIHQIRLTPVTLPKRT